MSQSRFCYLFCEFLATEQSLSPSTIPADVCSLTVLLLVACAAGGRAIVVASAGRQHHRLPLRRVLVVVGRARLHAVRVGVAEALVLPALAVGARACARHPGPECWVRGTVIAREIP